jgi:hypothetical protein
VGWHPADQWSAVKESSKSRGPVGDLINMNNSTYNLGGKGVCMYILFLPLTFLRWQEYKPIYVKVRAHNPLSWNYVCKTAAFEDTLKAGFTIFPSFVASGTKKYVCRMQQVRTLTHSHHGLLPPTTNHKQENHGQS